MADPTFLLIADIGGYTRFMTVHRINLAHAQYIVAQLLEAVIDAARPRLRLSKLEGDAAFFYAKLATDDDTAAHARRAADIRRAFLRRRQQLTVQRMCTCDACAQTPALTLKFVAHQGEVAFHKIRGHKELAGVDVILVHRLLKNDVPITEYVLMSDTVHDLIDDQLKRHSHEIHHDLEGLGPSRGYYIDLGEITEPVPPPATPTRWSKLRAWLAMTVRSLPYFVGLRKACVGFRSLEQIRGLPAGGAGDRDP
jgi:hypothetical protein